MKFASLFAITALSLLVAAPVPVLAADKPTDPQIAHIAYTAGEIDIKAAQQALEKATDPKVKAFAQDMVRDHTSVNQQALALCKKLGVTPQDNDVSKSMMTRANAEYERLAGLSGAAFDKAYIDNEVTYHHAVNGALESTLIPSTQNAELKSLLETGLKIFKGHEEHARTLAAGVK